MKPPFVEISLKAIAATSIPAALEKAQQYRSLGQAADAESICLDILACDDTNEEARVLLVLALTDQFERGPPYLLARAKEVVSSLNGDYARRYYEGVVCERQCKALLEKSVLRSGHSAYDFLCRAMNSYAAAESIRTTHNDETLLRWNACVRMLNRYPQLRPADDSVETGIE